MSAMSEQGAAAEKRFSVSALSKHWKNTAGGAILLAVIFIALAFYLPIESSETFRAPAELILAIGSCAFAVWALTATLREIPRITPKWLLGALIAVPGWFLLTSPLAWNPLSAFKHSILLSTVFALGIGALAWAQSRPANRAVLGAVLASFIGLELVVAYIQVWQLPVSEAAKALRAHGVDFLTVIEYGQKLHKPAGTMGNVNYLAEAMALLVPFTCGLAWSWRQVAPRILSLILLFASLSLMWMTGSRAAFAGIIIALPVAIALASPPVHAWLARMALSRWSFLKAFGAVVVAFGVIIGASALLATHVHSEDASIMSRMLQWQAAFTIWREHPLLGVGLGGYKLTNVTAVAATFQEALPPGIDNVRFINTHNEALQLLTEAGALGVLVVLGAMAAWCLAVLRNVSFSFESRVGLYWSMGAFTLAALAGFPLHIAATAGALALVMAYAAAAPSAAEEPNVATGRTLDIRAGVAIAGAVVMSAVVILGVVWPNFNAYRLEAKGMESFERGDYAQAEQFFQEADRGIIFQGRVRWRLMQTLVLEKKFQEVLDLYDRSRHSGLSMDANHWRGRALESLGRNADALTAYRDVRNYYSWGSEQYMRADKRVRVLEARLKASTAQNGGVLP